jgi:hypothetical protein
MCAALCVVIELLFADVRGGRSLNVYDPLGWTPLAPALWSIALGIPAGGLMVAVALPLYRRRYGGVVVGLLTYLTFLAGVIAGGMLSNPRHHAAPSPGKFEFIQGLVLFICLGVMAALLGQEGRSMALGQPDDGSSWSWPI